MITTGSVRGKCEARQSGQRRTQPADATRVGEPHWAQKRWRACQSISERASARIAASPVGIVGARVRTSISSVSMSGAVLGAARVDREVRAVVVDAEQDQEGARLDLPAPRRRGLPIERRLRRAAHERLQVAQRQQPRRGVGQQAGDPLASSRRALTRSSGLPAKQ